MTFKSGKTDTYDELISTIPIDQLVHSLATPEEKLINAAKDLLHNNGYSIGIGVRRPVSAENKTKCWNYFPENNAPFYRVTYLSNYSPNMTPNSESMLLMAETSYSSHKQINAGSIIDDTIDGLITYGLINECDREQIDTAYCIPINYGYPIPSLNRNTALTTLLPELKNRNIYSRGRFGAWQYEVGNMDHSFMQGVEVIDYLLHNKEETTLLIK